MRHLGSILFPAQRLAWLLSVVVLRCKVVFAFFVLVRMAENSLQMRCRKPQFFRDLVTSGWKLGRFHAMFLSAICTVRCFSCVTPAHTHTLTHIHTYILTHTHTRTLTHIHNIHTHTHTRAHTHTYIHNTHTYIHTLTHTHARTLADIHTSYIHTLTHAHTHTHTYTHSHTRALTYIRNIHTHAHTHTHTYITHIHTHTRTLTHIHNIHTHTHTYIHTYITHIHTLTHTHTRTLTYITHSLTHTHTHTYSHCGPFKDLGNIFGRPSVLWITFFYSCSNFGDTRIRVIFLFRLFLVCLRRLSLQLKCIYTFSSYLTANTNFQCRMFCEPYQTHNTLRAKLIVSISFNTDGIFNYRCLSEG